MKWFRFCSLALLLGCSAQPVPPPQRLTQPGAPTAGGMGITMGGAGGAGSLDLSNGVGLIKTMPTGGNVSMAGAGGSDAIPAGCEPGKFCAPSVPDPTNCGTLSLKQDIEVKRIPGNLLVLFDQSLSMAEPWGSTGQTKLAAAQAAIANAIEGLKDSLSVGALFFPTYACIPGLSLGLGDPTQPAAAGAGAPAAGSGAPAVGVTVAPINGEGQIPFQPGPQFLMAWQNHWGADPESHQAASHRTRGG